MIGLVRIKDVLIQASSNRTSKMPDSANMSTSSVAIKHAFIDQAHSVKMAGSDLILECIPTCQLCNVFYRIGSIWLHSGMLINLVGTGLG